MGQTGVFGCFAPGDGSACYSNSANTSSGSGASKSCGTWKSPRAVPKVRSSTAISAAGVGFVSLFGRPVADGGTGPAMAWFSGFGVGFLAGLVYLGWVDGLCFLLRYDYSIFDTRAFALDGF